MVDTTYLIVRVRLRVFVVKGLISFNFIFFSTERYFESKVGTWCLISSEGKGCFRKEVLVPAHLWIRNTVDVDWDAMASNQWG